MALTTALGGLIGGQGTNSSSQGSSVTNGTGSASSTSSPTFSVGHAGLQGILSNVLSSLVPSVASGGLSPNVQALQTQSANQINQNYASLGQRLNRFLAARGFGQSGQVGQAALQTDLGRQGALANNNANYSGLQLQQNNSLLSDALQYAFAAPGSTSASTTSSTGGSTWTNQANANAGLAGALAGILAGLNTGLNNGPAGTFG